MPGLPQLIKKARATLLKAKTIAEIHAVMEAARSIYDAARAVSRLAKCKKANDEAVWVCHSTMADALEIECLAQCRLADEYDRLEEASNEGS